jgi:integrase
LRDWKELCRASELDLVFPSDAGTVMWHRCIMLNGWSLAQREAGILKRDRSPKYKFHSMRHFFASIMIEQGMAPKRLQEILGHATIGMTMDVYGHLFPVGEENRVRGQ